MANDNAAGEPWEGGFCVPFPPPGVPPFDSAAIVVAQQSGAETGVTVFYSGGIFTRQAWSTGPPVPLLIEVLKPQDVQQIRDQVREQLAVPGDGLDHLPLRAFVTAADVYLDPQPSTRFLKAAFGAIAEQAPGQLLGETACPDGVAGTILGSDAGVSGESHLGPFPPGAQAPLRVGDLRSLIYSLENALAAEGIDPLWQQMLTFAQQAAAA
jgi:hypothetical protein